MISQEIMLEAEETTKKKGRAVLLAGLLDSSWPDLRWIGLSPEEKEMILEPTELPEL